MNIKIRLLILLLFSSVLLVHSQVPEFVKSIEGDNYYDFTEYNNKTYFISNNNDLWVTDGSTANTQMVTNLGTGFVYIEAVHQNKMYIDDTYNSLWISDGSQAGTKVLKTGFTRIFRKFISVGNLLFFRASTAETGDEWWVTDGTTSGTHITKDINPGTAGQDTTTKYVVYKNKLYFYGYSEITGEIGGYDFWVSDGTAVGTYKIMEGNYAGSVLLNYGMIVYKDKIYFTFHEPANGVELWVSDGTISGTKHFKSCRSGNGSGWPQAFNILDNKLLFVAYNENDYSSHYLWSTDGIEANTKPITKIRIIGDSSTEWIQYKNHLYFNGLDEKLGEELFVTDGTSTGTTILKDISVGSSSSSPEKFTVVNDKLIFYAYDNINGSELWVTNGTQAGTQIVKDIYPGIKPSLNYDYIHTVGNKAYFIAKTGLNNFQLIESDATAAGTKVVLPLNASITISPLGEGTFSNKLHYNFGALYFKANFNNDGKALYKLGTPILGIQSHVLKDQVLIYPNPTQDYLNIQNKSNKIIDKVIVTDLTGKKVLEQNNSSQLNVEKLAKGMYVLEVVVGENKETRKFIKE